MSRHLAFAALASCAWAMGCAGPKVHRSISEAHIGSKYARLTGYFATAKAAPGGRHEEMTPGHIRHEVIRDEATLVAMSDGWAAFGLSFARRACTTSQWSNYRLSVRSMGTHIRRSLRTRK